MRSHFNEIGLLRHEVDSVSRDAVLWEIFFPSLVNITQNKSRKHEIKDLHVEDISKDGHCYASKK